MKFLVVWEIFCSPLCFLLSAWPQWSRDTLCSPFPWHLSVSSWFVFMSLSHETMSSLRAELIMICLCIHRVWRRVGPSVSKASVNESMAACLPFCAILCIPCPHLHGRFSWLMTCMHLSSVRCFPSTETLGWPCLGRGLLAFRMQLYFGGTCTGVVKGMVTHFMLPALSW